MYYLLQKIVKVFIFFEMPLIMLVFILAACF